MGLVLYRKYRPKTFSEVIGQEHVVKTLSSALLSGLISHAYLFYGPRGSGKTTVARLLAKALNCQNLQGYDPCNQCSSCQEINQGRAIDLIEIDAASHRGIDEIRELREGVKFVPTKSKYKVFIIDESHQLTKEAANALLKTLEEPPHHVIFILATTEIQKMIPTIVSRCQRFDFRKLTLEEILKKLEFIAKQENLKIEKEALELIALNSGGSVRDAESLLDQVSSFCSSKSKIETSDLKDLLGMVDMAAVSQLTDLILEKKMDKALDLLNSCLEGGADPQQLVKSLISYLRQALLLKINPGFLNPLIASLSKEEQQKLKIQVTKFREEEIKKALKLFLEAENKMKYSPIVQLPIELAIIEFCS